jgi:hypothetical protein
MKRQKWVILSIALALMAGAGGLLAKLHASQKLGQPGVKTHMLAGTQRLEVELPERVLDYDSKPLEVDKVTLDYLPLDTSFGQRRYHAPDGFEALLNVVLMGADRTSIHKPQFCLGGTGWCINDAASAEAKVRIEKPCAYDLPVMKLICSRAPTASGIPANARLIYVYWFAADNALTARHGQRMWWMAKELLQTGVLQRWAYVTCSSACLPGQEEATFERMKKFIAAAVPEFQQPPRAAVAVADARGG